MSGTQQTEALRLARKFEEVGFMGDHRFAKDHWCRQAAAELRRLHARVQELEAAQAQRVPLSVEAIAEIAERFEATDPTDSFWVEVCRAFEGASVSGITQEKQG